MCVRDDTEISRDGMNKGSVYCNICVWIDTLFTDAEQGQRSYDQF